MAQIKESVIIVVLLIVILTNLYDLRVDYAHGAPDWHLYGETLLVLVSAATLIWLALSVIQQRQELAQLKQVLHEKNSAVNPAPKVLAARQQLGQVIQEQFTDWKLTTSEQEVAMLLLKGLSFKEIASVRETTEKTVRQQASTLYKKSELSGRHEFSAWFIEDFL